MAIGRQCASTVLMVAPHDFAFNEESSHDNEFQQRPSESTATIRALATAEFEAMVAELRRNDIGVVIPEPRQQGPQTPDAVFPNNWFATERDGTVLLFPMFPVCRRLERRPAAVETALIQAGFLIRNVVNIGHWNETEHFLEGTGSLVIDHDNKIAYAAISERCHVEQLKNFSELRGYHPIWFDTRSSTGRPIYHTNVMMSLGASFAVVCFECIPDEQQRERLQEALRAHHEVIEITREQVEQHIAGNILQVTSRRGKSFIVMSERSHNGFTATQRLRLAEHGTPLAMALPTIERVGGGSARCMIAEIFLPRQANP
jgi:hypothetical protein